LGASIATEGREPGGTIVVMPTKIEHQSFHYGSKHRVPLPLIEAYDVLQNTRVKFT
jgi:hypothetical protein